MSSLAIHAAAGYWVYSVEQSAIYGVVTFLALRKAHGIHMFLAKLHNEARRIDRRLETLEVQLSSRRQDWAAD